MATSPNQPSTAHKLKFIDLTKEIEDCSKDQTLSMYHYNTGSSTGVGPGNSNHSSGEIMNQNYHCGGSQRKKINKRFRNNPGFTSNFFFFPSSVAVNGNTSANMAINHKENSPPTPLSATSQTQSNVHTNQRKWSLTNTKKDQQLAGANPSDGKPFLISQQDDKGNAQLIENEETCHAFNEKVVKSPQSATPRSKRVSKSSRLQRRYSCSDYLPTSIPPTEQELAKIDRIYSPMSNYCFTPIPQGFYNFTFQSPNANASQQSPPTTHDSNSYHSTCYNTNDQNEERSAGEETDDWTFLDPNLKKRRPSFDLNNDEMDKLFNAFSFEPIREESDQNQQFLEQVIVDENSHSMSNFANQFQQTAVLDEQPQFMFPQQQDDGIGFMDLLQNNNNTQYNQVPFPTPSQVSNETELLFNSLPEELKKQLVSFLILHNNNQKKEDDQLVPDESTPPTSSMKEEGERRSTSTQEIEPVIGEESAVDVDQEQPLFEPITEIGLSELKDFGLLEDLEDAAILNTNESNDDFEQFLNNL